jgi:hypothetical protein
MPTGYTADVANGKITDFTEYALQCARHFGACVMLRDEPLSGDIPEFEPSDHNAIALEKAEQELSQFLKLNESQRRELHENEHVECVAQADKRIAEINADRDRYEVMLSKARLYQSPSPDHDNYAKFMVSQLEESIKFDCNLGYWEEQKREVIFSEWQTEKREKLQRNVSYHEKANREEIERTESRNKWVRQLKESLQDVATVV